MSIKEKPLINAVSNLGALPGFLFANQLFNGAFSILIASFMGAFCAAFFTMFGLENPEVLLAAMRWGARIILALSVVILLVMAVTAGIHPEETRGRLRFVLGATGAVLAFAVFDIFIADYLIEFVVMHPDWFGFDRYPSAHQ